MKVRRVRNNKHLMSVPVHSESGLCPPRPRPTGGVVKPETRLLYSQLSNYKDLLNTEYEKDQHDCSLHGPYYIFVILTVRFLVTIPQIQSCY